MSDRHGIRMPVIPCSEEASETALQALRGRQRSWCDYYFIFLSRRLADPGEVLRASLNVQIVFTRLLKASGTQANELQSCRRSLAARRHFLAQLQAPVCPTAPLCARRQTQMCSEERIFRTVRRCSPPALSQPFWRDLSSHRIGIPR